MLWPLDGGMTVRTATGLMLVAIGAILAFAVTAQPSFINLQITGLVIMLTGIAGLLIPVRGYGWLRRRLIRWQDRSGRVRDRVVETQYPPYVMLNPGTATAWGPDAPGATTPTPDPEPGRSGETAAKPAPAETEVVDEYFQT